MTTPIAVPSLLALHGDDFDALFASIDAALATAGAPDSRLAAEAGAVPGDPCVSVDELDEFADRSRRPLPVLEAIASMRRAGFLPAELRVAWIGAASPELHSWLEAAVRLGFQLTLAVPDGFEPDAALYLACEAEAPDRIVRVRDAARARVGADLTTGPDSPLVGTTPTLTRAVRTALATLLRNRNRPRVDFRALTDLASRDPLGSPGVGLRAQMR